MNNMVLQDGTLLAHMLGSVLILIQALSERGTF